MILVAGGTGRLGTILVERLTRRGVAVRVLTRDRERAAHLGASVELVIGDVRDRAAAIAAASGCEIVVSAVHGFVGPAGISPQTVDRDGNANLTDAAKANGADLVMMSVVGAALDSPMELFRMKRAAEEHARASGIPTTIVRATAFMELWIDLLRQTAVRSGRPLVFGRGDNQINFVSANDVAALVDEVVADPASRGAVLEIGGPENVTFNDLARAVQAADGRTAPPRHVPPVGLRLMANTVGRARPQLGRQARAALAMDSGDLTFGDSGVRRRYPRVPTTRVSDVLRPHV
ncbi:MAG TPA: SDR family oxidoreductase [Acidimicrobiales bacterium]|nr:SDR family oxidoreductase [Acidimicrobiales bacterium]